MILSLLLRPGALSSSFAIGLSGYRISTARREGIGKKENEKIVSLPLFAPSSVLLKLCFPLANSFLLPPLCFSDLCPQMFARQFQGLPLLKHATTHWPPGLYGKKESSQDFARIYHTRGEGLSSFQSVYIHCEVGELFASIQGRPSQRRRTHVCLSKGRRALCIANFCLRSNCYIPSYVITREPLICVLHTQCIAEVFPV